MANIVMDSARNEFWDGGESFSSTTWKFSLIDEGTDTPVVGDDRVNDVTSGAIVGTTSALASKTVGTVANGTIDAADPTATAVSGATVEGILLRKDTGTTSNDNLICYFNASVTGLPLTPNGGDVTVQINASGIADVT